MPQTNKAGSAVVEKPARLSPDELCEIAEKLVKTTDPKEIARLRAEFEQGFYGDETKHA